MGGKRKNKFYAYITEEGRGLVRSWRECEARVKGRQARYRGFPDRSSAERWLRADGDDRAAPVSGRGKKYYAYRTEDEEGVVETWSECEAKVRGRRARYRGFADRASAERWLADGARYEDRQAAKASALDRYPADGVFFDAGTGAGRGVELKVTDRAGESLLHLAGPLPENGRLTPEDTVLLSGPVTNNYGELMACLLALRAARAIGALHVFGDSRLVLDYWSKGRVSAAKRASDPPLARLAREVARERHAFEAAGGRLEHIPGSINPADLGFHRD